MIESILIFLQNNVIPLGAGGVFLASVAEEVIAPVPSALVMMTAGFLFVSGPIDLYNILRLIFWVGLPAAAGISLGSLWIYGVAYWGGKTSLDKLDKWLGLNWADIEKMRNKFEEGKRGELAIIGARILPVVPSVAISAFCGFMRMRIWKYFLLTFIGMFLRAMLMGAIGWQVGNIYYKYANLVARFENMVFAIIALIILSCLIFIILRKYSPTQDASADK